MSISFNHFGNKKNQSIVFLHGWQQNKNSFNQLIPFLYKKYNLYFLDLPGFGHSPKPPNSATSFDYANILYKWITEQKIKKPVLIGHSFGGKIASIITSTHPKKIHKLILIASSGITHPKFWYSLNQYIPTFIKKFIKPLLFSQDYKQAKNLLPIFKNIVKEDIKPIFEKITNLTLIIWGKNDKELPTKDAQQIHQLIPQSKIKIIKNTNHFPFWQKPKKIALIIDRFIQHE
ncbi:alpha/beta hydrolase [Patescibacteria group bacterium]|nr:alpha/beta hydrolase [Patescibacteria group bacterium]MCG2702473.1 alpha/beta hydrolase [Candidatus Parcubacteria bacterium]MBU4264608.1 alpha/beta hydrolase [Patescibacteria group bacterium]MBU4390013.1 alpha/beta hydrolase [Patescibacteria group bacterium]MBU4396755.1 alpha/beta hydrolase [Patescibacteria group bacterium]